MVGDWDVKPLVPYLGERWLTLLSGHAQWRSDIDIQLNDVGFTYQVETEADLKYLTSDYPYPLNKASKVEGKALLQASGNQQSISARLQLPQVKYQAEIDITDDVPQLQATNLVVGRGSYKLTPFTGHDASIRIDKFSLDQWLDVAFKPSESTSEGVISQMSMPQIPALQRAEIKVKELELAGIKWNDVDFSAKRKNLGWHMTIDSQEALGEANYIEPYDLSVAFERLHIYVPGLEESLSQTPEPLLEPLTQPVEKAPLITDFERALHRQLPNITLAIDDFWVQGYKVGRAHLDLQRRDNKLEWKKLSFQSGDNQVDVSGWWALDGDQSHTQMTLAVSGENNSDVMERFGISSGIQRAPFDIRSEVEWDGSPWATQVSTMEGEVNVKLGKGMISDVSGAARLLGLFSLDSIIRKMQLDFTDVFDKGMAFNSITGSGQIKNGVFLTNDIRMDAVSGEMTIKGLANLNTRTVDAEVNFTPDITSGIPVLTAFAVTPQTALYVLAITTVISPVVEVFTQVNYEVKGPMDSPVVKELSRSKGEFKLPERLRDAVK